MEAMWFKTQGRRDDSSSTDSTPPRIVGQARKDSRRAGMTFCTIGDNASFFIHDNSAEHPASRAQQQNRGKTGEG
jgi:hypothetical protein